MSVKVVRNVHYNVRIERCEYSSEVFANSKQDCVLNVSPKTEADQPREVSRSTGRVYRTESNYSNECAVASV